MLEGKRRKWGIERVARQREGAGARRGAHHRGFCGFFCGGSSLPHPKPRGGLGVGSVSVGYPLASDGLNVEIRVDAADVVKCCFIRRLRRSVCWNMLRFWPCEYGLDSAQQGDEGTGFCFRLDHPRVSRVGTCRWVVTDNGGGHGFFVLD